MNAARFPRLLGPDCLEPCRNALREAGAGGANISGRSPIRGDYIINFLYWHAQTEAALSYLLVPGEVQRLLYSDRMWALRQLSPTSPGAVEWAELELRQRLSALAEAEEALAAAEARWRCDTAALVVPDTNLLIHHEAELPHVPWGELAAVPGDVRVVILLRVIDELDRLKRTGQNHVRSRARATLRSLAALGVAGSAARARLAEVDGRLTTCEVLGQSRDHLPLEDADSEIVDQAAWLGGIAGRRPLVLTFDTGMQVRAGDADVDLLLIDEAGR